MLTQNNADDKFSREKKFKNFIVFKNMKRLEQKKKKTPNVNNGYVGSNIFFSTFQNVHNICNFIRKIVLKNL